MRLGFVLEYSLGHATHAQCLKSAIAEDTTIKPTYIDLQYHGTGGALANLPGIRSNWSVRASLAAYLELRPHAGSLAACLFHTQVTSLFSASLMRQMPSVISLDATPAQYDLFGQHYGHIPSSNQYIENLKRRMNLRALNTARKIVTWSRWTKDSLVNDYHIPADKVTVIPPGVDLKRWQVRTRTRSSHEPLNLLFVGGDFVRKGGPVLLEALTIISRSHKVHLHLVTTTPGAGESHKNVTVYRDLAPNSPELMELFALADMFVFPTHADCLPLAVLEALATGTPVITTAVGALQEAVTDGDSGIIVQPNDAAALAAAICMLANDPELRTRLSGRARQVAVVRFDAAINYAHLLDVVKSVAT